MKKDTKKTLSLDTREEGLRDDVKRNTALAIFHLEPFLASQDQT